MYQLTDSVEILPGVGGVQAQKLAQLNINSLHNLINWLPRRYLDCTKPTTINQLTYGQTAVILARVKSVSQRRTKSRKVLTTALLEDDTGSIEALWFNQPYLEPLLRRLAKSSRWALLVGAVRSHYQSPRLILTAPKIEQELKVLPVYPLTAGLTSRQLNQLVSLVLSKVKLDDDLSPAERQALDLITESQAYQQIHHPKTMLQVQSARRRLVFDQLLQLQLALAKIKRRRAQHRAYPIKLDVPLLQKFVKSLPFQLTDDQKKAIWQLSQELVAPAKSTKSVLGSAPMHRLLNGDVGSGKTVVAAALLLLTAVAGYRGALMAPTEILAQQHAVTLRQLLKPFKVTVGLMTAKTKQTSRQILVGTHALIASQHSQVQPDRRPLALVVVDEQHRFGVKQRTKLQQLAAKSGQTPHFLMLTATPIPRSLALILFGDLDVTLLRELPSGRKPIKTEVIDTQIVDSKAEDNLYQTIRQTVERGEQVYVVCPLIEEQVGEFIVTDERQSVNKVYQRLAKEVFTDCKVAKIHGKLKSEQQERVLQRFRDRKIDILVATSVVEVGVDIPNATLMVIESAERFGVAQLHQLRGRIGRSDKLSHCFLLLREASVKARERCQKVASTSDGFALARFDLQQRGPGDLVGLVQAGVNPLLLENLDVRLLEQAQSLARRRVN